MRSHTLILLCKYPTPGNVKTRLGKTIGMQQAAEFQRQCLHKLIQTHRDQRNYDLVIGLREPEKIEQFSKDFGVPTHQIFTQHGEDLGQIMHYALSYGLSLSKSVCLIGSDVPLLDESTVSRAFQYLQHHDTVIGPSDDGGYYLIGASQQIQDILIGMTYSTETVYEETIARLDQYGYTHKNLDTMIDIDTYKALLSAHDADTTGWISTVITDLQIDMHG